MFKILIALCCTIIASCIISTYTSNKEMDAMRQHPMIPTIQEQQITSTTHIETFSIPKTPEYESTSEYVEEECTTDIEVEVTQKETVQHTTEYKSTTQSQDTTEEITTESQRTHTHVYEEEMSSSETYNSTTNTYVFNITDTERTMLASIVYLECNIESFDCQVAVASVIFNRLLSGYWGDSLYDVLYAQNQFDTVYNIDYVAPNETNYAAVDYVIENGCTLPYYVMYFRAGYHFQWDGYAPYTVIDDTYFGYMTKDQ